MEDEEDEEDEECREHTHTLTAKKYIKLNKNLNHTSNTVQYAYLWRLMAVQRILQRNFA